MAALESDKKQGASGASSIRVLIVDDYEPWLDFACKALRNESGLDVVGLASDGLRAVQQAEQLQPDLILLDIGLPGLNGIEVARRIGICAPQSKILFVSENRSAKIVEAALSTGAGGYLVKSDAGRELLPAVKAVWDGKKFISASLAGHLLVANTLSTQVVSLIVTLITGIP
jgi:DNA-binding NarL/FixJ family response regulator